MSPQLATDIGALPEVDERVRARDRHDDDRRPVERRDRRRARRRSHRCSTSTCTQGSIATLTTDQIAVSEQEAKDRELARSATRSPVRYATDNATEQFTIGALYKSTELAGDYVIPDSRVGRRTPPSRSTSS